MAIKIGFNRHLEPSWLNKVAILVNEGIVGKELRSEVEEFLTPFFTSDVAKEKTRNLLLGIWDKLPKHIPLSFQQQGAKLLSNHESASLMIHWGMMVAKYPFFASIAVHIGQLTELDNKLVYSELESKMIQQYEDTETIKRSLRFVFRTMCNMGVFKKTAQGRYIVTEKQLVIEPEVKNWLAEATSYADCPDIWSPFQFEISA